jgi:predicted nucleic acid-binding protein
MRFWDSSAIVPLLVDEGSAARMHAVYGADPGLTVWWGTQVECASALARVEREGGLDPAGARSAFARLRALHESWDEVIPTSELRETAVRLLRVHQLAAADALQLAAAHIAAEGRPSTLEFVCLDDRLAAAADREGFVVVSE